MKKIVVFITVISIFLMNFAAVSAASDLKCFIALSEITEQKAIEVILSDTPEFVKVGEKVELTATTQKQGSSCSDNWSNVNKLITIFDNLTGTYISKAEFIAENPGTYTISYCINMSAGGSDTGFYGKVERTITVINPITLVGADIRDLIITPVYGSDGNVLVYTASGKVYAIWSDQSATPYSSIFFNFSPSVTEKDVNVTITNNGITYSYVVTVRR